MHEIKPTGIYSADEIAEIFDTTKRYVWSVLSSGQLIGRKVSKRWYSTGAALLTFLEYPPQQSLPGTGAQSSKHAAEPDWLMSAAPEDNSAVRVDAARLARDTNNHLFSIQSAIEKMSALELADNTRHTHPQTSIIEQIEREAALSKAWQDSGYSAQGAADLMNQRMQEGGPAPERDAVWNKKSVENLVKHLGLRQKS